jgi:toxin ParE1/3/4
LQVFEKKYNMKYQVYLTENAEVDLNTIANYLVYKLLAGENALKQIERIEHAIISLEVMPERYQVYDKKPWKEKNLREMVVDNYLVFYVVDNNEKIVTVIRIMYGKRDIEKQLSQIKEIKNKTK